MILVALAVLVGATILMILLRALWIRTGLNARQTLATLAAAFFIVVVVGLAATGRLNWIAAAIATVIPFAQRIGQFGRLFPWLASLFARVRGSSSAGAYAKPGTDTRNTTTDSPWLRMTLHHASGHMDGEVRRGRHQGRFLSELTLAELTGLFGQLDDYDSRRLLETYLDHHFPHWRQSDHDRPNTSNVEMTRSEALDALGLTDQASRDDVIAAHRRLIQKLHPDRGGSTYLAALLNRAKDVLIKDH
jgi:hypothetical protein